KATLSVDPMDPKSDIELSLKVIPLKVTTTSAVPPPAVVPVQLLAHLDMAASRLVQYDPESGRFVPAPEEISYVRVRLFARTIDDVPTVVEELAKRNLTYESQTARIREIHKQDSSLEFI